MKFAIFAVLICMQVSVAHAQMSASATFENTYSRSVRDACRAQFRDPEDRLKCAQQVVEQQRQDVLIQSQIEANNAQAELDRERTQWLQDNPNARYPEKRQ